MGLSNDLSCEAGSLSCCPPRGVFNQRSEALFPCTGALGCKVCFVPRRSPVYLCASVGLRGATHHSACPILRRSESGPLGLSVCECGAAGSASGQTACPIGPTLRQSQSWSWSPHSHSTPLHPGCSSLPLLLVWMYVYFLSTWCCTSLPFDFLSVLVVRGGAVCLPTPPSWFSYVLKCISNKAPVDTDAAGLATKL